MSQSHTSAGYTILHSFGKRYSGGQEPKAALIDVNGMLYGTTFAGGSTACAGGCGVVFSIAPSGKETTLYRFEGGNDGANPSASLLAVKGVLYGTTEYGGGGGEYGTVFTVSTNGSESVLYRFQGYFYGQDGANPVASLIDVRGKLYGTTVTGGFYEYGGTVFKLTTSGKEKVLHSFSQSFLDGGSPVANLLNVKGTLYGTTEYGGQACSCQGGGTVFSITRTGAEKMLYGFNIYANPEGSSPIAALIDVNGLLYGTAAGNGVNGGGTAFSVTTSGSLSVLYSFGPGFGPDASGPGAPLLNVKDTLYGTTEFGGVYGKGTVFKMSLDGSKATVLHSFGSGSDGSIPLAGLIDVDDTLYGTTSAGGLYGNGTVFALKLSHG
jgi:uncharacterized repeat protein (TIGR03803 family)